LEWEIKDVLILDQNFYCKSTYYKGALKETMPFLWKCPSHSPTFAIQFFNAVGIATANNYS